MLRGILDACGKPLLDACVISSFSRTLLSVPALARDGVPTRDSTSIIPWKVAICLGVERFSHRFAGSGLSHYALPWLI